MSIFIKIPNINDDPVVGKMSPVIRTSATLCAGHVIAINWVVGNSVAGYDGSSVGRSAGPTR
jgi:hypothetical protein